MTNEKSVKKTRRGRRKVTSGRVPKAAEETAPSPLEGDDSSAPDTPVEPAAEGADDTGDEPVRAPARTRRKRRSSRRAAPADGKAPESDEAPESNEAPEVSQAEPDAKPEPSDGESATKDTETKTTGRTRRKRRPSRRSTSDKNVIAEAEAEVPAEKPASKAAATPTEAEPTDEAETEEPASGHAPRARGGRQRTTTRAKPAVVEAEVSEEAPSTGRRLMVINVAERDECRIAILHQGRLEELFMERLSAQSHVGNIYKGRITNVEPSIQAAFIDFGLPKHGFLHISDLQPQYFPGRAGEPEDVGRKTPRRERPPIQKCLRRGQEVIVQITKEGIGTKGPTLTTYISLPGRYLVMMPGMNRLGVSRKIEDFDDRRSMRDVLNELDLPKGMGFILRTAGMGQTRRELQRDLNFLQRLWKVVAHRIKHERAPCELYQESDLVIRTIRDVYSSDFAGVIVDDEQITQKVRDFLAIAAPRAVVNVQYDAGPEPLFHRYGIESEIEQLHSRRVPLPLGGSLVIESTEALVAIDVNSGTYRARNDADETAYHINLEAAEEIARQLRLRDLGGLIICDFIDMRLDKHRRGVERALRDALKEHKERAKALRISRFGIIEITRQRTRPSIKRSIYQDCPHCAGTGLVKTTESMSLEVARLLRMAGTRSAIHSVEIRVAPDVDFHLQNRCRQLLYEFEQESGRSVVVAPQSGFTVDQVEFVCRDARGGLVRFEQAEPNPGGRPKAI